MRELRPLNIPWLKPIKGASTQTRKFLNNFSTSSAAMDLVLAMQLGKRNHLSFVRIPELKTKASVNLDWIPGSLCDGL
jgi:hypothetical protein